MLPHSFLCDLNNLLKICVQKTVGLSSVYVRCQYCLVHRGRQQVARQGWEEVGGILVNVGSCYFAGGFWPHGLVTWGQESASCLSLDSPVSPGAENGHLLWACCQRWLSAVLQIPSAAVASCFRIPRTAEPATEWIIVIRQYRCLAWPKRGVIGLACAAPAASGGGGWGSQHAQGAVPYDKGCSCIWCNSLLHSMETRVFQSISNYWWICKYRWWRDCRKTWFVGPFSPCPFYNNSIRPPKKKTKPKQNNQYYHLGLHESKVMVINYH